MQRETTLQSLEFEGAAASGFAMAQNEKYRRQRMAERQREWRKVIGAPERTGKPNVAGWEQLARVMEATSASRAPLGTVSHGGESFVQ